MFIGKIKETGRRVHIDDVVTNNKHIDYVCPICNGKLILKNGPVNVAHFAHQNLNNCDSFSSDMSEWHKEWQNVFPKTNQEVVLSLNITNKKYITAARNHSFADKLYDDMSYDDFLHYIDKIPIEKMNIKHRADVLACGYVIEFQHSPISTREFNERNWFYTACGYKVIWIFDFVEQYETGRINYIDEWSNKKDNGSKYRWKFPSRIFRDFIPQDHKPQYRENEYGVKEWWNGDITIFFQLYEEDCEEENSSIEKIIWSSIDNHTGTSNFKYFLTSYYPGNKREFLEYVKNRKL